MTVRDLPEVDDALEEIRSEHPRAADIFQELLAPHRAALENDWLSTGAAAEIAGVSTQTIRNWVDAGWLESRRRTPFGWRQVSAAALRDVAMFRNIRQAQLRDRDISEEQAAEALQARRRTTRRAAVGSGSR